MTLKKLYIIGDSHAEMCRRVAARTKLVSDACQIVYRPFGAVKQGIRLHHRLDGKAITLLEDNWREKTLPFDPADIGSAEVGYCLSLPFNSLPMLRLMQPQRFTFFRADPRRAFLSKQAMRELILRRNQLGVALARDMVGIGLNTFVMEAPRPFENHEYVSENQASFDLLCQEFYRQTTESLLAVGAQIIGQPAQTINPQGRTRGEFSEGDQQHGTPAYYGLQIEAAIDAFTRSFA
ncbi:MAG: hypothetical protein U1D35_10550 [Paracoccaceae bacterium]|nr:hypothetical protein [Paracoccaceae bacterium]